MSFLVAFKKASKTKSTVKEELNFYPTVFLEQLKTQEDKEKALVSTRKSRKAIELAAEIQ